MQVKTQLRHNTAHEIWFDAIRYAAWDQEKEQCNSSETFAQAGSGVTRIATDRMRPSSKIKMEKNKVQERGTERLTAFKWAQV